jgi:hypothetical protein
LRGATGSGNVAIGPNSGSVTNIGNNAAAATTVNVGNTGTSAFGTVNVGRGATAVFIGDNVASAITLGKSTGSVTLGPPLTLGAAPTTSAMLGGQITSAAQSPVQIVVGANPFAMLQCTVTIAGTYFINANTNFQSFDNSGTMTFPELYLYTGTTKIASSWGPNNAYNSTHNAHASVSGVRSLTVNDIVYLFIAYTAKTGTTTFSGSVITLTRIA